MSRPQLSKRIYDLASVAACALAVVATAMPARAATGAQPMITVPIDNTVTVTMSGNIRPEIATAIDLGAMADSHHFDHLFLQLARSPEREAALNKYLNELNDKGSPNFHKWLTPAELNDRFGVASEDLATVITWLTAQGFKVGGYTPNMVLDVAGTARQIRAAFGADIHMISVNGVTHFANVTNPTVPAALAPVLKGPVVLNDFKPHPMMKKPVSKRKKYTFTEDDEIYEALVPGDLQTIYNFTPVYNQGLTGAGQTIVVVEDSDLYTSGDWYAFRKILGLSKLYPQGSLTVSHPAPATGSNTCTDPGDAGSTDAEAAIDVEWASAAAPNAAIVIAVCKDTSETAISGFGGFVALQNILTQTGHPNVVSISYGESEPEDGATGNLYVYDLYQTAASEGVSVFVSSGDEGASSSDADAKRASHGINVSGWTSTPYNVSVGGLDYEDTYLGTNSNYWSPSNGKNFASALSYIPEIPWNDTCAGQLFVNYIDEYDGFTYTNGTQACNNSTLVADGYTDVAGGSGGPSNCATGTPANAGVANGTCAGWPKPSWQAGLYGNPADGVRDIPDVSLMASNGFWGHYYVVCYSHAAYEGTPCTDVPSSWAGYGGTSVSSPIMAGIQALINQKTGEAWGNPNPIYYAIANREFGTTGNALCNSSAAGGPAATCDFHDITVGDMADACVPLVSGRTVTGTFNCYGGAYNTSTRAYTYGVLSTSNTALQPAYGTNPGWDFSSGIGSPNAFTLVNDPAW
jgi:subtilase family serine protease